MSEQFSFDTKPASAAAGREGGAPVAQFRPHTVPARVESESHDAAYGSGQVAAGDEGHLRDYFRIVYDRRWPAITAFLVIVLSAAVYTFTATPVYEARTQVLIESGAPNVVAFKDVIDQEKSANDYYQTQYQILQSRSTARQAIESLKLWDHQQFVGSTPGVSGWVAGLLHRERTPLAPVAGETAAQSRVVEAFLKDLTIAPIRNTRLVDVRFRSPDAALSARVANGVAKAYIEQNLRYRFTASKDATEWLGSQLEEQRAKVEESEQAVQGYREQNGSIALQDHENIVVQKLADLNAAVTRSKTERIQKEALYQQVKTLDNDTAIDAVPAILGNTFIQSLKAELNGLQRHEAELAQKLGDKHPEMIKARSAIDDAQAKLDAEVRKLVSGIRNEYLAALSQERSLVAALEAQKGEAMAMNRKGIDYGVLVREAESNRQIYESLLQRAKETGVSAELKTSSIRVVDEADVPQHPVSPQRGLNLLLGLFGGAFAGLGLAFFFESMDNRLKSPDAITEFLGLPFLGIVPAVHAKVGDSAAPLISRATSPVFSEAFRSIRTNVLFSSADEGLRSILVTSTKPDEGKSLVASNLAIAMAQASQRVLLVDADMRRPKMHDIFDIGMEPGLSNVLVADAKITDAIRPSGVKNLWLLTAGKLPPNPAELLGSKNFKRLLASLGDTFEWVVFDAPPVMAVTDPSIAAHQMSGVVFVVGNEMTARTVARTAVKQLRASRATVIGAVLNRVDLDRASCASPYFSKEYSAYYQASANG